MEGGLEKKLALSKARADRLKKARAEAELLLEKKSRELYEANQKLELAQSKLEDDIKQATYELSVSNERLQTALNERSTFIGQMSHEVRTPLNAIIGLSEILHRTKLDEAQRDYVETINSGAKSLVVLLNDMLDITKIEAGRVDIKPEPTNTRRIHENIVAMFAIEAKDRGLVIGLNVHDAVPSTIRIDKGRYKQIINNLISNALKNTEKGSVIIEVGYAPDVTVKGVGLLQVKVVDTGVGIADNQLARIFNAYEQIGRPHQGVGLGLAICQQLCDLMMGEINCESELGSGSTFSLSLPVEVMDHSELGGLNQVTPTLTPLPALRILIAEDNPINQKVITAQLSQLGQRATVVNNGAQAVSALSNAQYDVVILDILMPVMGGEEAIEAIRTSSPEIARHYCIALTASTYENQRDRLLSLGFDAFLSKPLSLAELSTALHQVPMASGVVDVSKNAHAANKPSSDNLVSDQDIGLGQSKQKKSFDFSYLKTQFGEAHKAIFKEIAPTFLEYAYADLERLKEVISNEDETQTQKVSHSLKGAASSIGLSELANVLLKIENKPNDTKVHHWLAQVVQLMSQIKPLIEQELDQAE